GSRCRSWHSKITGKSTLKIKKHQRGLNSTPVPGHLSSGMASHLSNLAGRAQVVRACPKTTASATLSAAFVAPLCRNWPKFDKVDDKVSNSRLMRQALVSSREKVPAERHIYRTGCPSRCF